MRHWNEQISLDWDRQKVTEIKKRGNLAILMPQKSIQMNTESKNQSRCVWPSAMESAQAKVVSRRVWGR